MAPNGDESVNLLLITFFSSLVLQFATAGESILTATYQPLAGLGTGEIAIVQVTCHHWHGGGSAGSAVDLIGVRNVPPTDEPKLAKEDLNLASVSGLRFVTSDLGAVGATPFIALDASQFDASMTRGYPKEDIVRAALECLNRCRPEKLADTPVTLRCAPADKSWLGAIVDEFNRECQRLADVRAERRAGGSGGTSSNDSAPHVARLVQQVERCDMNEWLLSEDKGSHWGIVEVRVVDDDLVLMELSDGNGAESVLFDRDGGGAWRIVRRLPAGDWKAEGNRNGGRLSVLPFPGPAKN